MGAIATTLTLGYLTGERSVRKSGKGFTKRNHLMKYLCGLAKVKPFGFHGIRHLSGSVAIYGDGVSLLDIQQLLRHRSLTTTQRYVHRLRKDNKAYGVLEAVLKRDTPEGHVNEKKVTA